MSIKKILSRMLLLSGVISAGNLLIFYFLPFFIPMANFSIIKIVFIAYVEKKYGYVLISTILVILILMGSKAVERNGIWLPVFSFIIFLGDLIHISYIFVSCLFESFINTVVLWFGVIDILFIGLFILYFVVRIKRMS